MEKNEKNIYWSNSRSKSTFSFKNIMSFKWELYLAGPEPFRNRFKGIVVEIYVHSHFHHDEEHP